MRRIILDPSQVVPLEKAKKIRSPAEKIGSAGAGPLQKGTRKIRLVADLNRLLAGKPRTMRKAWDQSVRPIEWKEGDVLFTFRKATTGVGVLTARWPGAAMPYHVITSDVTEARNDAQEIVSALRKGATPKRGVFRREDAPAPRRRQG